jgi:transposase
MPKARWQVTEHQWLKLQPFFPKRPPGPKGGRKWIDDKSVFEALLWILWTGSPWEALPDSFPSHSTCWRRLKEWEETGVWEKAWKVFLGELDEKGQLKWSECFMDGSFAPAKKGGIVSEKPRKGRAQSGWFWSTAKVFLWQTSFRRLPKRR